MGARTGGRPSKYEKYPEDHGPFSIQVKARQGVYLCQVGPDGRASVGTGNAGKTVTVIIHDEEKTCQEKKRTRS